MGVRLLTSVVIAGISGVAALAASVPTPHLPTLPLGESVSAVVAGTMLIALGSAMRRSGPSK
jgi:hypothetical protein